MTPLKNQADTVRAVFLSLDCPREALRRLFDEEPEAILSNDDGFTSYLDAALNHVFIEPTPATGVEKLREFATFAAAGVLRVHRANPFVGTKFERQEPPGSAERRMLHYPIQKHPGVTVFEQRLRDYYIATLSSCFEQLPDPFQAEIAAVILAPDKADPNQETAYQTYADNDPRTIHQQYSDRVEITADGDVRVSTDYLSRRCQLLSKDASRVSSAYPERFNYHEITRSHIVIPEAQFRLKFAEYAWHGWMKLVNIAYNTLCLPEIDQLVTATSRIAKQLIDPYSRNDTVYTPYYGSNTENPKRDWQQQQNTSRRTTPAQVEDKRLISVVDCIRASPDLSFDTPIPVETVFDRLREFFPAPHRPGNDIATEATLRNALKDATHDAITIFTDDTNTEMCKLSSPRDTPIYPSSAPAPWEQYRATLAYHRHRKPKRESGTETSYRSTRIHPVLPAKFTPENASDYPHELTRAQQSVVTDQRTVQTSDAATLRVNPDTFPDLTRDEVVFLTRVALAMERRIKDISLTRSMRPLRDSADGSELTINEEKLRDDGWLERHKEGESLLYTVPKGKRKQLGVTNVSNDGYGEKTTAEKSLHRAGVDQCAAAFAAKPDVTRVVRYCDLWRLRTTPCEDTLATNDLLSTRIDVIAFADTTPKYAAGVETASNSPSKPRRCIEKLTALSDTIETWFVVPDKHHLWTCMRQLNDPEYFEFDTFPDSTSDNYDRSNWQRKLQSEGILGKLLNHIHTYRSLPQCKIDSATSHRQQHIVGNI